MVARTHVPVRHGYEDVFCRGPPHQLRRVCRVVHKMRVIKRLSLYSRLVVERSRTSRTGIFDFFHTRLWRMAGVVGFGPCVYVCMASQLLCSRVHVCMSICVRLCLCVRVSVVLAVNSS